MMPKLHNLCKELSCSDARPFVKVLSQQDGSSLIELALVLPLFFLMLAGSVDFGRGFYVAIEVSSAAQAGVSYGVQQPGDIAGIQMAAKIDAPDVPNLATAVITGCECSDGTSAVVGCSSAPGGCTTNIVNYVQVSTSATYTSILKYPGIPTTINMRGNARMRAVH